MEKSPFDYLFGSTTATITVVDEPPSAQLDPFKIPMKIVKRVMNNCYLGDGTIHPGDHLLFIHKLCELFKCAGISTDQVKRKLFSLSLKGRAAELSKLLKNGRLARRKWYLYFILNSILLVRFIKIGIKYITFGLKMERVLPSVGEIEVTNAQMSRS
jgi:hypothetical protein